MAMSYRWRHLWDDMLELQRNMARGKLTASMLRLHGVWTGKEAIKILEKQIAEEEENHARDNKEFKRWKEKRAARSKGHYAPRWRREVRLFDKRDKAEHHTPKVERVLKREMLRALDAWEPRSAPDDWSTLAEEMYHEQALVDAQFTYSWYEYMDDGEYDMNDLIADEHELDDIEFEREQRHLHTLQDVIEMLENIDVAIDDERARSDG